MRQIQKKMSFTTESKTSFSYQRLRTLSGLKTEAWSYSQMACSINALLTKHELKKAGYSAQNASSFFVCVFLDQGEVKVN